MDKQTKLERDREYFRNRYKTDKKFRKRQNASARKWRKTHSERWKQRSAKNWLDYVTRIKPEVFSHYGSVCYCCGESITGFLTLDHANDDGGEWRKKMANAAGQNQRGIRYLQGVNFYLWLRKNNYPQDLGLRVACYNCNLGRARNRGTCPHQAMCSTPSPLQPSSVSV